MKRLNAFLAIAIVLSIVLSLPATASADSGADVRASLTGTVYVPGSFAWVRSGPGTAYKTVGRLYHGAAVTVMEAVAGPSVYGGKPLWYRVGDGRYVYSSLVKVSVALTPTPTPTPAPAPQANSGKWIEVILSQFKLIAWEGDTAVLTTIVAIGKPSTPTVKGTFRIYSKYRYKDMSGPGYYQPRVPHAMFFYGGYSIHGTYWHQKFGQAVSHGCVNVNLTDAEWLYNWAPIGTKVVVHN
jgi:lipoprotein-anchoring transpeptidase ErfK/SrfK